MVHFVILVRSCSFSTLLDTAQAATPSKAVMTALIMVGVVLVVGGVAITVLICIRRQEARKKEQATSGGQQATPTKLQGRAEKSIVGFVLAKAGMVEIGFLLLFFLSSFLSLFQILPSFLPVCQILSSKVFLPFFAILSFLQILFFYSPFDFFFFKIFIFSFFLCSSLFLANSFFNFVFLPCV